MKKTSKFNNSVDTTFRAFTVAAETRLTSFPNLALRPQNTPPEMILFTISITKVKCTKLLLDEALCSGLFEALNILFRLDLPDMIRNSCNASSLYGSYEPIRLLSPPQAMPLLAYFVRNTV